MIGIAVAVAVADAAILTDVIVVAIVICGSLIATCTLNAQAEALLHELASVVAVETESSVSDHKLLTNMNQLVQKQYAKMLKSVQGTQPQIEVSS